MFFGMESVAYFFQILQIYTPLPPSKEKKNQFCLFFHFFWLKYLSAITEETPPKKTPHCKKFAQEKKNRHRSTSVRSLQFSARSQA
jgi:hypothetical protein